MTPAQLRSLKMIAEAGMVGVKIKMNSSECVHPRVARALIACGYAAERVQRARPVAGLPDYWMYFAVINEAGSKFVQGLNQTEMEGA